jgi:hypothetical protein
MNLEEFLIFLMLIIGFIFLLILAIPAFICYHICKRINWKAIKNIYYLWWNDESKT